jgi:hypothetical protein
MRFANQNNASAHKSQINARTAVGRQRDVTMCRAMFSTAVSGNILSAGNLFPTKSILS